MIIQKKKIGKLVDMIFEFTTGNIKLTKIKLGNPKGSWILKDINFVREDTITIPIDYVRIFDEDKIILQISQEIIEPLIGKSTLEENEFSFSTIQNMNVLDSNGDDIGSVETLWFYRDKYSFVIERGLIHSILSEFNITEEHTILLHPDEIIRVISNQIKTDKSLEELDKLTQESEQLEDELPPTIIIPKEFHPNY